MNFPWTPEELGIKLALDRNPCLRRNNRRADSIKRTKTFKSWAKEKEAQLKRQLKELREINFTLQRLVRTVAERKGLTE